jgi:hypothetical protein
LLEMVKGAQCSGNLVYAGVVKNSVDLNMDAEKQAAD